MKFLDEAPEELRDYVDEKYGKDCSVFDVIAETFEEFQLLEELEHNCELFMRIGSERFRFVMKRIREEDRVCWACYTGTGSHWFEKDED